MDKEPKKPEQQEEQGYMITNIPLTIIVSALINTKDWFDWIMRAAEVLVVFVLTYQILGKTLFVALVVTPLIVGFLESCFDCWSVVCSDDWDDGPGGNDGSSGDDPHFDDHFNNNLK